MKAFKGFNADLTCRGFQYEEGKTYEHDGNVALCSGGFHAVLLPLDVVNYYKPKDSVYHEVELEDVAPSRDGDSKVAARKITVGAKIGIPGLVKAHVEAVWASVKKPSEKVTATTGDYAHAATTGDYAHAATTGDSAHAATTGDSAHAATTGDYANAATTGDYAHAATTGDYAHAATTGRYAHAATTGRYAHAATTGDSAHAATTGRSAHAATTGRYANAATTGYSAHVRSSVKDEGSIAAVLGHGAAAGALGCWIVLTERDDNLNILDVQAFKVDGKKVKANTFYQLVGGKLEVAS
ncbi:hypothetical protein SPF06_00840 [Sinomonas sp. JGH33]|uniref:DUF7666 domain-containing protein n=1 Tax=Sinomonas terricola TaxID=3110330 RepID=A0ABU5T0S5_9MICC|nr:hypothetical protein [Sinomonas sp. JGH33]MEA5453256.1 hypothetical protein [Sinomonas sp. JGH33]